MIKALGVALLLVLGGCAAPTPTVASKPAPAGPPPPPMPEDALVCAADVKLCVDGSYVARDPDNGCAFARCPAEPHP